MRFKYFNIGIAFGATILSGATLAQGAHDLADLVGARAAGGETQLEARGYSYVTTNTVRDTKWAYWYNERIRQCVQIATSQGRYSAINPVPEANCRRSGDASTLPSFGAQPVPPRPDYGRPDGNSLTLICFGSGTALTTQHYSGYSYNSESRRFEPQFGNTLGREGFASDVQVEIWRGRGRIHLTGRLVAPIHSGGQDGWWPIDDLVVTRDRITGRYRMNGLNKPRIEIDRRTRIIRINGIEKFSGRCDVGDWRSQGF